MQQRLTALVGALLALYLLIAILTPAGRPQLPISKPISNDSGRHGLMGLQRWLQENGVKTKSLRLRYDKLLHDTSLSKRGNLLILSLPQSSPMLNSESQPLYDWLATGNHLLLLIAADDHPAWSHTLNDNSQEKLLQDLGFKLQAQEGDDKQLAKKDEAKDPHSSAKQEQPNADESVTNRTKRKLTLEEVTHTLYPTTKHPLLRGVKHIEIKGWLLDEQPNKLYAYKDRRAALVYLHDDAGHPAFWEMRYGESRLWLSRYADLFGNVSLGLGDNARLLANLISSSVDSDGTVVFDDMHQGLTDIYDPKAFFGDSRLHNSLWFMLSLWLFYVIGHSNRLAPLRLHETVPRAADFVRASAGLFARRLNPVAAARSLYSHFFDTLRLQYGYPCNGQPLWDVLEASPRVPTEDLRQLHHWYDDLDNNKHPELIKLSNLMHKTRSALL